MPTRRPSSFGLVITTNISLVCFPLQVSSLVNFQQETALAFFIKNCSRLYPSHIHKLFLTWRPCGSESCSFLKYCDNLPVTASGEFEDTSAFVSIAEKEAKTMSENKQGNNSKETEENSSQLSESYTNSAGTGTSPTDASESLKNLNYQHEKPHSAIGKEKTLSEVTQNCKLDDRIKVPGTVNSYQNNAALDEYETAADQNAYQVPSTDNSELIEIASTVASPTSHKLDTKNDEPSCSSKNREGLSPCPRVLATKMLEGIDLTQFEHDQEDKCVESEPETSSTTDLTRSSHDVFPGPSFEWPEPNPLSYAAVTARFTDRPAVEATITRIENVGHPILPNVGHPVLPNVAHSVLPNVLQGPHEGSETSRTNLPQFSSQEDKVETKLFTSHFDEFGTATASATETASSTSETNISGSSKKQTERVKQCACEKRNSKLPLRLFDRFQATIFQLSKSWPSIHGTILGFSSKAGLQNQTLISSEKLDTFTDTLLSNPFDIIFELFLKTIQSQLQTRMSSPRSWKHFTTDNMHILSSYESEEDLTIPISKRFLRSVIRQLSIRLSKNANFDASLRYKIGRHAKQSSEKKEDRLRDSIK